MAFDQTMHDLLSVVPNLYLSTRWRFDVNVITGIKIEKLDYEAAQFEENMDKF